MALSIGTVNSLRRYSKSVKERATKVHYSALQIPKKAKTDRAKKPTKQEGTSPQDPKLPKVPKPKEPRLSPEAQKAQEAVSDQKIKLADMEEKLAQAKQRILNVRKKTPEHLNKLNQDVARKEARIAVQYASLAKLEEAYNKLAPKSNAGVAKLSEEVAVLKEVVAGQSVRLQIQGERIARLEKRNVENSTILANIAGITQTLSTRLDDIAVENAEKSQHAARLAEQLDDKRREMAIAELQAKENVLESLGMQNIANDNYGSSNDNAPDKKGGLFDLGVIAASTISGVVIPIISKMITGALGAVASFIVRGIIPRAILGLLGFIGSPIIGAIAAIGGVIAAATYLFKDNENGLDNWDELEHDLRMALNPTDAAASLSSDISGLFDARSKLDAQMKSAPETRTPGFGRGPQQKTKAELATDRADIDKKITAKQKQLYEAKTAMGVTPGQGIATKKSIALSPEDMEALARLMQAEAGNQGDEGKAAVAWTVLNRVAYENQYGKGTFSGDGTVQGIINAHDGTVYQYEPIGTAGGSWKGLAADPSSIEANKVIIQQIISGKLSDPTKGATSFQNVETTDGRGTNFDQTGGASVTTTIGNHTFYDANVFGNSDLEPTARDYEVIADRSSNVPDGVPVATASTYGTDISEAALEEHIRAQEEKLEKPIIIERDDRMPVSSAGKAAPKEDAPLASPSNTDPTANRIFNDQKKRAG